MISPSTSRRTRAKTRRTWTSTLSAALLVSFLTACGTAGDAADPTTIGSSAVEASADEAAAEESAAAAAASSEAAASEAAKASAEAEAQASASAEAQREKEREKKEREKKEEAERKKAEAALEKERLDPATYEEIDRRAWAQVVRDPDAFVGDKYVIYGYVTQFDSATGIDTFRADTDAVWFEDWYDYDHNTLVTAADSDVIKEVLKGDVVKMHVQVGGSFTYDTQIGGSTTVPVVLVNIIEILSSSLD